MLTREDIIRIVKQARKAGEEVTLQSIDPKHFRKLEELKRAHSQERKTVLERAKTCRLPIATIV